jgi:hypothetical protein
MRRTYADALLSQAESLPVAADIDYLRCVACGQAVIRLRQAGYAYELTGTDLISAVRRHALTVHRMQIENDGEHRAARREGKGPCTTTTSGYASL